MRLALHWVCSAPSSYNDHLFDTLAADPEIDLRVHYVAPSRPSHPWRARRRVAHQYRAFDTVLGVDREILGMAARAGNRLVVGGWNTFGLVVLLAELAALGRPYLFWTDTPKASRRRGLLKRTLRTAVARSVFGSAAAVMGAGRPAVDALRAMGCPGDRLVNLPYFVDVAALARTGRNVDTGCLRLASAGQLVARKAFDTSLRALSRLKQAGRISAFTYDIASAGPEERNLRNLTARLGLTNEVRFRGWIEADEIRDLVRHCDLFLHPVLEEPFGVAVLEAMAAGGGGPGNERRRRRPGPDPARPQRPRPSGGRCRGARGADSLTVGQS